jgi:site-specific recombinase XerD
MKGLKFLTRFSLISSGKKGDEKQIHLVVTVGGQEVFYYSGYRIHPANFLKETIRIGGNVVHVQQAKKNTYNKAGVPASRINTRLRELEMAAERVYNEHYAGRELQFISKVEFKERLLVCLGERLPVKAAAPSKTFFELYWEYHKTAEVSKGYRRGVKSDIERMERYASLLPYKLDECSFDIEHYKQYLFSGGRKINTVVTIFYRFSTFLKHAKGKGWITKSPFDGVCFAKAIGVSWYNEPVCITREELRRVYETHLEGRLRVVKDMFCFQAAVGCRVSNLIQFTVNNIQGDKLVYFPVKRGQIQLRIEVPLSARAKEIIAFYKDKGKGGFLMPYESKETYNELIKLVFKEAKLDRQVMLYNREAGREEYFKLYELASSHMARRTFIDVLCQAGEPLHVVSSMSGHVEHSRAFGRYRSRPEQLQITAVSRSMD